MNELAFELTGLSAEWVGSEQQSCLAMTHLLTTLQKRDVTKIIMAMTITAQQQQQ